MDDFTMMILEYLVQIIVAVGGAFIIKLINTHLTKEKQAKLEFWIKAAVKAAEMLYEESGQGELKKEFVLNFVRDAILKNFNLKITEEQLDLLIEAIVYEVKILKK